MYFRYTDTQIETLLNLYKTEYTTECLLAAFRKSCYSFVDNSVDYAVQLAELITDGTPQEIVQLLIQVNVQNF